MIETVVKEFPFAVVATTLRKATTASRNDWGALCYSDGAFYQAQNRPDLEIYDRVGGGDGFASGLIYGFLRGADRAVGRGMRRGARRAGHDHSRRYHHGHGVRSAAAHEGEIGAHRKIRGWQLPGKPQRSREAREGCLSRTVAAVECLPGCYGTAGALFTMLAILTASNRALNSRF